MERWLEKRGESLPAGKPAQIDNIYHLLHRFHRVAHPSHTTWSSLSVSVLKFTAFCSHQLLKSLNIISKIAKALLSPQSSPASCSSKLQASVKSQVGKYSTTKERKAVCWPTQILSLLHKSKEASSCKIAAKQLYRVMQQQGRKEEKNSWVPSAQYLGWTKIINVIAVTWFTQHEIIVLCSSNKI